MSNFILLNPSLSADNKLRNNAAQVHQRFNKISGQLSSGNLYENFTEMEKGGELEMILMLESSLNDTKNYYENNHEIRDRITAQDQAFTNIIEILKDLKLDLISAQSSSFNRMQLDIVADYSLSQIADNLNSKYAGFYLFSGSRTLDQPLGDVTKKSQLDSYYGNNETLSAQLTEMLSIEYNDINANNLEIKNTLETIYSIKEAYQNQDQAALLPLEDEIDGAISWFIETRAQFDARVLTLDNCINAQDKEIQILKKELSEKSLVTDTNFAQLYSELKEAEVSLKIIYQMLVAGLKLNLADYI